jgi:hypothetical protein
MLHSEIKGSSRSTADHYCIHVYCKENKPSYNTAQQQYCTAGAAVVITVKQANGEQCTAALIDSHNG